MGIAAVAKKVEAKDLPILQSGKKENFPPSTKNHSWRRLRQVLDEPPSANQECAKVG